MTSWHQTIASASRPGSWQPTPAHETQAIKNSALTNASPSRQPETQQNANVPGGRALDNQDRTFLESRLGADFSRVRVHPDGEAAETAESLGARALTVGNDIAFAPGEYNPRSTAGRSLLAHELTHTLQQGESGELAVQMQGKQPVTGLGSKPPKDDFTVSEKSVPSDDFVLFDLNQATLSAADEKKLTSIAAAHKGPVTVTVHGYASEEGDSDYNINLAAWRAVALKKFLSSKLDPKSKIILYSNGKTTDFGPLEKNRRAGFTITDGVVDAKTVEAKEAAQKDTADKKADDKKPAEPWTFDITKKQSHYLSVDPNLFTPGLGPGIVPPYLAPLPSLKPPVPIDWHAIRPKFSIHGLSPEDRDLTAIETHWNYSYNFLLGVLGDPALAAKGANLAVPYAVNKWLTLQYPNAMDTAQKQFEDAYNTTTYIIPLSDIVDAALQKVLKRDKPLFEF